MRSRSTRLRREPIPIRAFCSQYESFTFAVLNPENTVYAHTEADSHWIAVSFSMSKRWKASHTEPTPSRSILQHLGSTLCVLPNVVGWFIGPKWVGGRRTKRVALCLLVSKKVKRLAKANQIPKELEFRTTSTGKGMIETDVVHTGAFERAAYAGAGDGIVGPPAGTVGIAMQHPNHGAVVTSAGHVFASPTWTGAVEFPVGARPVILRNVGGAAGTFHGDLLRVVVTERADYAVIRPTGGPDPGNVYHDAVVLGRPYAPSSADPPQKLFVLSGQRVVETQFRGVEAQVPVGSQGIIRDAILTNRCTSGGDSGACLVDESKRPWGLLVGFSGQFSVFMSVQVPLYFESADYL